MAKHALFIVLLLAVSGCSSPSLRKQWREVSEGQDRDSVIEVMGKPDEFYKDGGQDILVWRMDRFEKCAAMMTKDGKVQGKSCKDNPDARAKADAASDAAMAQYMMMRGMQQPSSQPMRIYSPTRPTQTQCTGSGNQVNCTSRQTGIDSSIYGN